MAPKKGTAAKSTAKGPNQPSEGDHIVFTNNPSGGKNKNEQQPPGPPRPDTRKIIGGASWTGKLPVGLLSEHCQRERWNKPDYSMRRVVGGAHRSSVTLSKSDPKTREMTKVPSFELPDSHAGLADEETALEARHFAATYALFRVASMKNIHMTLPPKYRDLWKGPFQELKKEDVKEKREWKYDPDPFAANSKRKEIKADIEKRKVEHERKTAAAEKAGYETPQLQAQSDRIWSRALRVELGQNLRSEIEAIVRRDMSWSTTKTASATANLGHVSVELKKLGFRDSHLQEAAEYCTTAEEIIEWLLIHIPEDDLPKWALPQGYTAGISLASGDVINDAKIRRLGRGGYSPELCTQALRDNKGDEKLALEALQYGLHPSPVNLDVAETSESTLWSDELMALEAVYGEKFQSLDDESCSITMDQVSEHMVTVRFQKPSAGYPICAVPLLIVDVATLPAYIRLSATRRCVKYAWDTLLGDQMIYSMIEHLQSNLPSIIKDPGRLVDLEMQATTFAINEMQLNKSSNSSEARTRFASTRRTQVDRRTGEEIRAAWATLQVSSGRQKMNTARQKLPAWAKAGDIVDAVNKTQVTLITGDTGSGKSTQSVQFVLDDAINRGNGSTVNILCTQPRRVAALALSDRVAEERCSAEGDEVGYIIRGASKISAMTKITFMTTGVLLRRLQLSQSPQEALRNISHVFIDEVHERSLDTDFLLALLKSALPKLPKLTLVLMSATVDPEAFIKYFGGSKKVARVHIEGRTFPVSDYYLDDVLRFTGTSSQHEDGEDDLDVGKAIQSLGMGINYNLIASLVEMIDMELGADFGGVLIFLPGTMEIDKSIKAINQLHNMHALPLHASLLPSEQKKVFPPAPKGLRKVICSTNVAETSVTISDIVAVIDTGRVKETTYDISSSMVRLQEVWASQAACKQRRGRAGRVQAGTCYKLFTRNVESSMRFHTDPEVKRVPLEQLCLSVWATTPNLDVADFLASMLSPPDGSAVDKALTTLHRVGALENGTLTGLGSCMAAIPADLKCAKLIIYGTLFGCLEACLTTAAILTTKSPFVSPRDKRQEADEARRTFPRADGDLLLDRAAFDEWKEHCSHIPFREARTWTETRFLSQNSLRDIDSTRQQLLEALKEAALIPTSYHPRNIERHPELNSNTTNTQLLRALIAGSLTPNLAEIRLPDKKYIQSMSGAKELDPEAKTIRYFTEQTTPEANGRVFIHPSSVLFDAQAHTGAATYISYFNKMATSKTFVRELTPVNAYGVLLFGGKIEIDTTGAGLVVDGWIRMRGWARIGVLVGRLRKLLDRELRRRIDEREDDVKGLDGEVVDVVRRLVELNGQDA